MTDVKLVELIRAAFLDVRRSEQVAQELISLLGEETKVKIYDYFKVKALAELKAQKAKIEEAIGRYE
jgi:hypothetical protein